MLFLKAHKPVSLKQQQVRFHKLGSEKLKYLSKLLQSVEMTGKSQDGKRFAQGFLALNRVKLEKEAIKLESLAGKLVLHIRSAHPTYPSSKRQVLFYGKSALDFSCVTLSSLQLLKVCTVGMVKNSSDSSSSVPVNLKFMS